jgi:DNA-binding transcriptional MocR family regulator
MAQGQKRHTRLVQMPPRIRVEPYALAPRPRGTSAGAWLCATLRADIQGGRLAPGSRLPSSRHLARLASLARGTVVTALEQLEAEGYVDARSRSGVFVADRRPPAAIVRPSRSTAMRIVSDVAGLEPFVRLVPSPRRAFVTNVPAVDLFREPERVPLERRQERPPRFGARPHQLQRPRLRAAARGRGRLSTPLAWSRLHA